MTDARLYPFGHWPEAPAEQPEPTELGKQMIAWLRGEDVPLTPDLSRVLLIEFRAQETYRQTLTARMTELVKTLQARASEVVIGADAPVSPAEAYAQGYKQGAYNALANAAQAAQDTINAAAASVRK